jgi:glycosyltransferase involved in cell wall biosynthesis
MEYLGTNKPINKIKPVVSVCITAYNHEPFIAECLETILMQETDFPFEIIVGEDDSTDGTREICKAYAEKHPDKIRLFLRDEKDKIYINGRKTGRFNYMENLKAARGVYIAMCDGDDYWLVKDKLQRQRDFMQAHPECTLVCHRMPSLGKSQPGFYNFKQLAVNRYLAHASNYFFKPVDLKKYKQAFHEFLGAEMLVLYIAAKEGLVYHDERVVSYYRFNENGVYSSLNEVQKLRGELFQLEAIQKYFRLPLRTYLNRKMGLINKLNLRTGEKKREVKLFKLYKISQRVGKVLRRRIGFFKK